MHSAETGPRGRGVRGKADPRPREGSADDGQASAVRRRASRDTVLAPSSRRVGDKPSSRAAGIPPVLLGPVPCKACGKPVTWNRSGWSEHRCAPDCMTEAEMKRWQDDSHRKGSRWPGLPCMDCPVEFAREMRLLNCCNGEPGKVYRLPRGSTIQRPG
jgi:hypothetical protein